MLCLRTSDREGTEGKKTRLNQKQERSRRSIDWREKRGAKLATGGKLTGSHLDEAGLLVQRVVLEVHGTEEYE